MATNFLFWNTNRKDLTEVIAAIAMERDVDVLILSECVIAPAKLLVALNASEDVQFHFTESLSEAALVFTKFSGDFPQKRYETKHLSIRSLRLPATIPILIAIVSFPSKLFWSDESQAQECGNLARQISKQEERESHEQTLLVGDFNMNPFEHGMAGSGGLNATMARSVAGRKSKIVQGQEYPFFYNPMWNLFGDDQHPAGTYFYRSNGHVSYFWHMFDQVLVRPDLMHRLPVGGVEIIVQAGGSSLVNAKGVPDTKRWSDHLPIFFRLNLEADDKP